MSNPPNWRTRSLYLCPPVTPPGTGFPFHRLVRLVGLRWRYSNPPPRGVLILTRLVASLYNLSTDHIENIISNSSSIVACVTVAVETCLARRCLVMPASIRSTILAFSSHVTVLRENCNGQYYKNGPALFKLVFVRIFDTDIAPFFRSSTLW
jgi:hypothetical protein